MMCFLFWCCKHRDRFHITLPLLNDALFRFVSGVRHGIVSIDSVVVLSSPIETGVHLYRCCPMGDTTPSSSCVKSKGMVVNILSKCLCDGIAESCTCVSQILSIQFCQLKSHNIHFMFLARLYSFHTCMVFAPGNVFFADSLNIFTQGILLHINLYYHAIQTIQRPCRRLSS